MSFIKDLQKVLRLNIREYGMFIALFVIMAIFTITTDGVFISSRNISNLLNQMQLFKIEALKSDDFDRDVINLYDNAIKETSELIDTLTRVEALSEENITIAEHAKKHIDSTC